MGDSLSRLRISFQWAKRKGRRPPFFWERPCASAPKGGPFKRGGLVKEGKVALERGGKRRGEPRQAFISTLLDILRGLKCGEWKGSRSSPCRANSG